MHAFINRKSEIGNRKSSGFSLIELIVVTAILTVVLSGIVAVFLGSMKAVRQGYRHMDVYEMSRGAFQVVQRDLTGGFTSRDNGDYYQFYGTPYGMTFVGVAGTFQGIGNNQGDNLSRVTYVIRQLGPEFDTATGTLVPDPRDTIEAEAGTQQVFSLIRYVEKGVDDLGGFPVDWTGNDYLTLDPTEFPDLANQAANLQQAYTDALNNAANLPREEGERYMDAVKRDIWLRMLRGDGKVYLDENGTEDTGFLPAILPDFFEVMPRLAQSSDPAIAAKYAKYFGLNVRDYIVATNIQFSVVPPGEPIEIDESLPFNINAFSYGFPVAAATVANPNNLELTLPITDPNNLYRFGSSVIAFRPFWSYMEFSSVYRPNLPYYDVNALSGSTYGGEGSPLMPRIPAAVHMRVRLKFPAPNVAAAEIQRVLDQTIDVPSAFTRTQLGLN